jgi:hypothetical protein
MISKGREPRVKLQYAPPVGTVDRVEVSSRVRQTVSAEGLPSPEPVDTTIRYTIRAEVTKETPEGVELALELTSIDGTTPEDRSADTKPDYSKAKGAAGTLTVFHEGMVKTCELRPPPGAPPEAAKAVSDAAECLERVLFMAVPPEEVGPGASWSISEPAERKTEKNTELTFKLPSAAKDRYTVQMTGDAPPTGLSAPDMPGMTVKVNSEKGTLSTECVVVVNHALPVRSSCTLKGTLDMSAEKSGQSVHAVCTLEQTYSLRPLQSTPPKKGQGK